MEVGGKGAEGTHRLRLAVLRYRHVVTSRAAVDAGGVGLNALEQRRPGAVFGCGSLAWSWGPAIVLHARFLHRGIGGRLRAQECDDIDTLLNGLTSRGCHQWRYRSTPSTMLKNGLEAPMIWAVSVSASFPPALLYTKPRSVSSMPCRGSHRVTCSTGNPNCLQQRFHAREAQSRGSRFERRASHGKTALSFAQQAGSAAERMPRRLLLPAGLHDQRLDGDGAAIRPHLQCHRDRIADPPQLQSVSSDGEPVTVLERRTDHSRDFHAVHLTLEHVLAEHLLERPRRNGQRHWCQLGRRQRQRDCLRGGINRPATTWHEGAQQRESVR